MQETRLLLIRHAETSTPNLFHGAESDIGLSDWGQEQARILGGHLASQGANRLYCSGMRRARETATPVGIACNLTPVVTPTLHERKIGPLSGMTREDGWDIYAQSKTHWIAGELDYTHPGGESFADIQRRVVPKLRSIVEEHPGETVVVIAHGVVIRVALITLLDDLKPADFDQVAIDFASINDLRIKDGRWGAEALNLVVAPSPARPVA